MSASLTLNIRVIHVEGNEADIAITHFATDSGMLFRCSFDENEVAKWAVGTVDIRGNHFSYFGQFVGELSASGKPVMHTQFKDLSDFNRARIVAIQNGLSHMLNEFNRAKEGENFLLPEEIESTLNDQVIVLNPDFSDPARLAVHLLPFDMTQREMTIGMAKISPYFNLNQPAHILHGNNATGVVKNVLEEVESEKDDSKAH